MATRPSRWTSWMFRLIIPRYLYATKEEEKSKGKLKDLKVKLTRNGWLVPPHPAKTPL